MCVFCFSLFICFFCYYCFVCLFVVFFCFIFAIWKKKIHLRLTIIVFLIHALTKNLSETRLEKYLIKLGIQITEVKTRKIVWEKCTPSCPVIPARERKYIPCNSARKNRLVKLVKVSLTKQKSRNEKLKLCKIKVIINPHGNYIMFI